MKKLLTLLLITPLAYGATISHEALKRGGIEVTGYEFRLKPDFGKCNFFEPNDTNKDGKLDIICRGVKYNPCVYGSVSQGYTNFFNAGGSCPTDNCDDLNVSPQPPGCTK